MQPSLAAHIVIGLVAAGVTFVVTPVVAAVSVARGWVAPPNERSVHTVPIPHAGGLAMLIGLVVALGVAAMTDSFREVFTDSREPIGVLVAAIVVYATGFLDDSRDLPPPAKVTGIVIAALVLVWFGATMFYFRVPFLDVFLLSGDWQPVITVLWLLGMTQAINLIDGLDGLAAGIVAIAAATFLVYSLQLADEGLLLDSSLAPLLAVIVLGTAVGFLPHNVHPARIFMGDSGALLLGLLMAAATMLVGGRTEEQFSGQTYFFFAPLFIPLFILGVPILDTAFAIVRRATKRSAVHEADKDHLHHRLLRLGHGHRRSVLILWAWTALLSCFVLYPTLTGRGDGLVPIGAAALGLALYTLFHPSGRRRTESLEAPPPTAADAPAPDEQPTGTGG